MKKIANYVAGAALALFVGGAAYGTATYTPPASAPAETADALTAPHYATDAVVQIALGSKTDENGFMTAGTCTGTVLGDGYVLTAGHCADLPAVVIAWTPPDKVTKKVEVSTDLELMAVNTKYDVALYRIDRKDWASSYIRNKIGKVVSLADHDAVIGQSVWTEGYPYPFEHIRNYGHVASGLTSWAHWPVCQVLNVVGAPGISGAPVFDTAGHLVGIYNGGPSPFGGQGIMIPASVIRAVFGEGTF